jgi:predicted nucleic acid-binding protein
LQAWRQFVPQIVNNLPLDNLYEDEPERAREVLQSWEALRGLTSELVIGEVSTSLDRVMIAVNQARELYGLVRSFGLRPDSKSNEEHLEPIEMGINLFRRLAEI